MENSKEKCEKIVVLLDEIINTIYFEKGFFFEDLEKAKKIADQKKINQLPAIVKRLDNFTMLFYNQRFVNDEEIIKKLNQIYLIVNNIQ